MPNIFEPGPGLLVPEFTRVGCEFREAASYQLSAFSSRLKQHLPDSYPIQLNFRV
jgi:hypothetical protein